MNDLLMNESIIGLLRLGGIPIETHPKGRILPFDVVCRREEQKGCFSGEPLPSSPLVLEFYLMAGKQWMQFPLRSENPRAQIVWDISEKHGAVHHFTLWENEVPLSRQEQHFFLVPEADIFKGKEGKYCVKQMCEVAKRTFSVVEMYWQHLDQRRLVGLELKFEVDPGGKLFLTELALSKRGRIVLSG